MIYKYLLPQTIIQKGKVTGHGIHSPLVYNFCVQILSKFNSTLPQAKGIQNLIRNSKEFSSFEIEYINDNNINSILLYFEESILDPLEKQKIFVFEHTQNYANLISEIFYLSTKHYLVEYRTSAFFICSKSILCKQFFFIY